MSVTRSLEQFSAHLKLAALLGNFTALVLRNWWLLSASVLLFVAVLASEAIYREPRIPMEPPSARRDAGDTGVLDDQTGGDCSYCGTEDVKLYRVEDRTDEFDGHDRVCWDCYASETKEWANSD